MKELLKLLKDVRTLQANLLPLSESQLQVLLDAEMNSNRPRKLVVERVHQRFTMVRAKRERAKLFKEAGF